MTIDGGHYQPHPVHGRTPSTSRIGAHHPALRLTQRGARMVRRVLLCGPHTPSARVRMGRWLAVQETWSDVRHGTSRRSGGVVAGAVVVRIPLAWIEACTKAQALERSPAGATAVLSFLSLDCDDRDGWTRRPLGAAQVVVAPYFGPQTVYYRALMTRAEAMAAQLRAPLPSRFPTYADRAA